MITKILPCDKCGRVEITGELDCSNERLCAVCFASRIGADVGKIRSALEKMMLKQGKDGVNCVVLKGHGTGK